MPSTRDLTACALQGLRACAIRLDVRGKPLDALVTRTCIGMIRDSPHIVLPDGGRTFDKSALANACGRLCLPARTLTIEYMAPCTHLRPGETPVTQRLLLAHQGTLGECLALFPECGGLAVSYKAHASTRGVLLLWFGSHDGVWVPGASAAFVPCEWRYISELRPFIDARTAIAMHEVPLFAGLCTDLVMNYGATRAEEGMHRDLIEEISVLVGFCLAWQDGVIRPVPLVPGMRAIVTPAGAGFHIKAAQGSVRVRSRAERRRAADNLAQRQRACDISRMPPGQVGALVAVVEDYWHAHPAQMVDDGMLDAHRADIRAACSDVVLFDRGYEAARAHLSAGGAQA